MSLSADNIRTVEGLIREPAAPYTHPSTASVQVVAMDLATNTVYAAGTQFSRYGICATNLTTGAFTNSGPLELFEDLGLSNSDGISSMAVHGDTLFVGASYGVVIQHRISAGLTGKDAFQSYEDLQPVDQQRSGERVTAIAATDSHAIYAVARGYAGAGSLGVIDRGSGRVSIHPAPVSGRDVIGLIAHGSIAYGSAKSEDGTDGGVVFAFDLTTGHLLW